MIHRNVLHRMFRAVAAVSIVSIFVVGGCSTYVNVPAQQGDIASNNPDRNNVVDVQAAALAAIIAAQPLPSPVTVRLAPGTTPDSYARALPAIGDSTVKDEDAATPNLDVRRVLIRAWKAQVDVVRADTGTVSGEPQEQLLTAYMHWQPFSGWSTQRLKLWRMPVEQALIQSRAASEISISE